MAEFGSRKDGRYNELSKSYKSEPSIENYVRLRRTDPAVKLRSALLAAWSSSSLWKLNSGSIGFDPAMIASVLDANTEAIGELSLQIMEKMVEAKNLAKGGQTHLARRGRAIPDKLVNWLIACMLDALSGMTISTSQEISSFLYAKGWAARTPNMSRHLTPMRSDGRR